MYVTGFVSQRSSKGDKSSSAEWCDIYSTCNSGYTCNNITMFYLWGKYVYSNCMAKPETSQYHVLLVGIHSVIMLSNFMKVFALEI